MIKGDTTKKMASSYIKKMSNKMIDQGVDQTLDRIAEQINTDSGIIGSNSIFLPKSKRKSDSDYLIELYQQNPNLLIGEGFYIHKLIGKLPTPKGGFTLPGYRYAGPYNPLDKQLKYDKNTGEILEIYQQPSGKTDAVAMQHDDDYSLCNDDKDCKHNADKKMVKTLDAIPWKDRQWGHAGV